MRFLVTGGAGFIGSNYVRHLLATDPEARVTNFDKLTYAGNRASVPAHDFDQGLDETIAWYRSHEGWWRPMKPAGATRTLDHGRAL
jgi:dTDP-D-glucose 4,6-dehydratase